MSVGRPLKRDGRGAQARGPHSLMVLRRLGHVRADLGEGFFEIALEPRSKRGMKGRDLLVDQLSSKSIAEQRDPVVKAGRPHPPEFDAESIAIEADRDVAIELTSGKFVADPVDKLGWSHLVDFK